ncbi:hypothetical protein [Streptomyces sp. NPDC059076]|uniref:hypothetical protein n=1 Tax=unclassified Streptomyces TaxID=2593676 RepID=UPI00367BC9B3
MWEAFELLEPCLDSLLATATAQLDRLPAASLGQWQSKIDALASAAETLTAEHDQAVARLRDRLVRDNTPSVTAIDSLLTEFYDEAWPALDTWATGALAITELNATVNPHGTAERLQAGTPGASRGSSNSTVPTAPAPGPNPARRGGDR